MSYTAPPTFVSGAVFTAANANILGGDIAFLAGTNSAFVVASQTTTSTAFTDLSTAGPACTVTTGASALVILTANIANAGSTDGAAMGFAVSGATTLAASATTSLQYTNSLGGAYHQSSAAYVQSGLNAGSNTFTAKYAALTAGTGVFGNRFITVIPLP